MVYLEGREARRNNEPKTANPYPHQTSLWQVWNEGWAETDAIIKAMAPYEH